MSGRQKTSRNYRSPHRPFWLRWLHAAWGGLGPGARVSLRPDDLVAAARAAEGLEDLGDESYRPALEQLVGAIEAEAALHPLGRAITRARLVGILRNRLRAEAWIAEHPEILARPLPAPIVIAGLPRTGTTLLQRLLASDPRIRVMVGWEGANPAPLRPAGPLRWDSRRARGRLVHVVLRTLAPDFLACHPIELDSADEEIILLEHSFLSMLSEVMMHVPSFVRWMEAQDQGQAYRMLRRMLLLLDWQRSAERWVLKTPQHLEHVGALLAVFPDAVIVHTHRDPAASVASTCSMVAHARGFLSDAIDPDAIGRRVLEKTGQMMDAMLRARAQRGDGRFIDVDYDDLVAAPLVQVGRVLRAAGLPASAAAEAAVQAASRTLTQRSAREHVYDLGDFGLTEAQVAARFSAYRARFGAPPLRRHG